ncbi:MAG TPA: lytic transglycosylase domain-containing protein [Syntrophorhabdaceae bacterium]|nr:lytic transglycosylase domain-containing protein [Syntrophorhabdaceae bacterium]
MITWLKRTALVITIVALLVSMTAILSHALVVISEGDPERELILAKTVQFLKQHKVTASDKRLETIAHSVYEESERCSIDYRLVLAVMKVESNFKNDAVSSKGARGLLQIKPSLAKFIAKDTGITIPHVDVLHEPEKNIKIGVNYLSKLMDMFENLVSALHAYNVGPSKAKQSAGKASFSTGFTNKVMREYKQIIEVLPGTTRE